MIATRAYKNNDANGFYWLRNLLLFSHNILNDYNGVDQEHWKNTGSRFDYDILSRCLYSDGV